MNWFFLALVLCTIRAVPRQENSDYMSRESTVRVKGFFTLLVLLYHFSSYITPGADDAMFLSLKKNIGQSLVAMFMFYSGYGIMEQIKRRGQEYVKTLPSRFLKVLLQFVSVVIVYMIYKALVGKTYSATHYLLSLVGWSSVGNSNWYIFVTLCLYVITFLAFVIPGDRFKNAARAAAVVLLCSVLIVMLKVLGKGTYFYNTLLVYPLGMLFSMYRKRIEPILRWHLALPLAAVLYGIVSFLPMYFPVYEARVFLFTAIVLLISMRVELTSAVLAFAGSHVFSIYIMHRLPMDIMDRLGMTQTSPYLSLFTVIAVTCVLAVCFDETVVVMIDRLLKRRKEA